VCTAGAGYGSGQPDITFAVVQTTGTSPFFDFEARIGPSSGTFATGTYTPTNVSSSAATHTEINGTSVSSWLFDDQDGGATTGFTLVVTATGTEEANDGGEAWIGTHGTLTVTMDAKAGTAATGTITATANF
jgi:hypothetical protein